MRSIGRAAGAAALALAAVLVSAGSAPAGAGADPVPTTVKTYTVWHWNVAGHKINKGLDGTASTDAVWEANGARWMVDEAVGSIKTQNPDFVSFNEICRGQYEEIRGKLSSGATPWTEAASFARFATTHAAGTTVCNGEAFGNALFSKAELGISRTYVLPADYTQAEADSGGYTEDRSMLCAPLAAQPKMKFCTTHITGSNRRLPEPTSPKINGQQLNAVRDILDGFTAAGESYLVAGDFNAQPGFARLGPLMEGRTELDGADPAHCPGYGEWTALDDPATPDSNPTPCAENLGNPKIDLILAPTGQLAPDSTYTADSKAIPTRCSIDGGKTLQLCSDHRVLTGTATLTVRTD
ncbi:endonuclease/exonuclease/phosphatase family protein [Streptomyces sp. NPDC091371]|uniref:endonuclease/exonuclease/phosphatase family protein n=1 Tax=Streptomyces sp. NPDC091371 TaxID=3155303 RepID=UPI003443A987